MNNNSSYTITAKPIKMLELHYPMIQFLIKLDIRCMEVDRWRKKLYINVYIRCIKVYI